MKNSIISPRLAALAILIVLFVLLFFQAGHPGLNWLLFGLAAVITSYFATPTGQRAQVVFPAAMLFLSAVAVFIQPTVLSIAASIVSFCFLAARMTAPNLDPVSGFAIGFFNLVMAPIGVFIRLFQRLNSGSSGVRKLLSHALIPAVLVLVFSVLYYNASPTFKELVSKLQWDEFPQLIVTSITGLFFSSVLLYSFVPEHFRKVVEDKRESISKSMGSGLQSSWRTGIWALCVLLGIVVGTDFYHQLSGGLPKGMTYAEYLHQGVFSLIVSIVFSAVISILTSNYTAEKPSTSMRTSNYIFLGLNLVYVWQNILRNSMYIHHYGLTEKRITIYFYLILCITGLALTIYSVYQNKPIRFLYQSCAYSILTTLVVVSLFNWSAIITRYNVENPSTSTGVVDYNYLLSLEPSNTAILYHYRDKMTEGQQNILDFRVESFEEDYRSDVREFQLSNYLERKKLQQIGAIKNIN